MIEPLRTQKLAEAIAAHIEGLILEGVVRPGERLASERDLAAKLDVSRPSLRDALATLEARGLLVTTRDGTRVADFLKPLTEPLVGLLQSDDRVTTDYFEYREAVESRAAGLAAVRASDPERQAIRHCLDAMEQAHGLDDVNREAESDIELHRLIYEGSHNLVILHVMRAFSEMLRRDIFFSRVKLFARPAFREALLVQHKAIGEAVIAGDASGAEQASRAHLVFIGDTVEEFRRSEARASVAERRLGRSELVGE